MIDSKTIQHETICYVANPEATNLNDISGMQEATVRMIYRANDPCAVILAFPSGDGGTIEWHFTRQLLQDGLKGISGEGDVIVHPITPALNAASTDTDDLKIAVHLRSPDGQAVIVFKLRDIACFLHEAERLVSREKELSILDSQMTEELKELFGALS